MRNNATFDKSVVIGETMKRLKSVVAGETMQYLAKILLKVCVSSRVTIL